MWTLILATDRPTTATAAIDTAGKGNPGGLEFPGRSVILQGTMTRLLGVSAFLVALAACVPGSPVYFGPPLVILEGDVQVFEDRRPIPGAEVCVFGTDTLCVAADQHGAYRAEMREGMLLEGASVSVRFRAPGLPTALTELEGLEPGEVMRVDCAITNRFTLSNRPVSCLPVER
jgi:hypothetical protein